MAPSDRIPFVASLDDFDGPEDVIDVLALGPFVAGVQPAARSAWLQQIPREATALLAGVTAIRVADSAGSRSVLAEGDGWTMRSIWWSDGSAKVLVVARDADLATDILNQATTDAAEAMPDADDAVPDGLIGQGLRLLVAITTNEPLSSLHPAVARPGRCLAEVHVGALSPDEAAAWLGCEAHGVKEERWPSSTRSEAD